MIPSAARPDQDQPSDPADLPPLGETDRVLAALAYLFTPIAAWLVFLFAPRGQNFRRAHAQQAIVFGLVVLVFEVILAVFDGRVVAAVAYLVPLALHSLLAFRAYTADAVFLLPALAPLTRRLFPDFPG